MTSESPEFKDFILIRKPDVASYTFRGNNFVYWFNITFAEGRIYLSGDCGDNVFTVRETDVAGLKNWLLNLDEGYALSKGILKRDHYDEDFAKRQVNIHLLINADEGERTEEQIQDIIDKLDFTNIQSLMQTLSEQSDIFPDYWELESGLVLWSPMAKMQYKQLKFAGEWFQKYDIQTKDDIRYVKVRDATKDFALLREQRSEKDNIHLFTQLFKTASRSYTELNKAEQTLYLGIITAKS